MPIDIHAPQRTVADGGYVRIIRPPQPDEPSTQWRWTVLHPDGYQYGRGMAADESAAFAAADETITLANNPPTTIALPAGWYYQRHWQAPAWLVDNVTTLIIRSADNAHSIYVVVFVAEHDHDVTWYRWRASSRWRKHPTHIGVGRYPAIQPTLDAGIRFILNEWISPVPGGINE